MPESTAKPATLESGPPHAGTGVVLAMTAFTWWGIVFPLYVAFLNGRVDDHGGPGTSTSINYAMELVAHRVLWACVLCLLVLVAQRQIARVRRLVSNPRTLAVMVISGLFIGVNWLTFIYGVSTGRLSDASLGYYICPLFSVLLGVVVFRERLRRLQIVAILIAAVGVGVEWWYVGSIPWISLTVASTFAVYGMIRKRSPAGPIDGLAVEAGIIGPLALCYVLAQGFHVFGLGQDASGTETYRLQFGATPLITFLLVLGGFMTAFPLVCFAASTKRLRLSTVGFLQFFGPTFQFLTAVFLLGEWDRMSTTRVTVFILIWIGVGIYIIDAALAKRRPRSEPASSPPDRGDAPPEPPEAGPTPDAPAARKPRDLRAYAGGR